MEKQAGYDNDFVEGAKFDDGTHSPTEDEELISRFSPQDIKRLMRKVDYRLVPLCGVMYCVSLLDRTNLSNAAIAGMTTELRLDIGARYSLVSLIFFVSYTALQPPATLLTRKIGPRIFLSTITLLWGLVMLGMGFINNWTSLLALRVVIGVFETRLANKGTNIVGLLAGFFPGTVYLLSTWYTRYEVGKRYSFFYLIGVVASACGGILAFGLMQMEGIAGYGGWRWIFIIEGLLTVVVAGLGFAYMRPFPDKTGSRNLRFLTSDEQRLILARVNVDRGDAAVEKFTIGRWARSGLDWKIWAYATIFGCVTTVTYALAYFLPIILNQSLGFTVGVSQCLIAPPYVFAGAIMILSGWFGDKYHNRGIPCAFNATLALIGLAIVGFHGDGRVRYFGVFLATAGANANVPTTMAYQANNIRGQWKRAFCSATLVGFGAIGGIIGTTVFRSQDAPAYIPGLSVAMGAQIVIVLLVVALTLDFKVQNGKAKRGLKVLEEGDKNFRYTY